MANHQSKQCHHLSAVALLPIEATGQNFAPLGAGGNILGLPGEYTSPSRFVQAVAFSQTARDTEGGFDTGREAYRNLSIFNVPTTAAEGDAAADETDDLIYSATQWTAASDLTNKRIYFHTQWNRNVRMIDVSAIDFTSADLEETRIPLDSSCAPSFEVIGLNSN